MGDEILGGSGCGDERVDLRSSLRQPMKGIAGKPKSARSYLPSNKDGKKQQSDRRRDVIKSSIFSALDISDRPHYDYPILSDDDDSESASSFAMFPKRSKSLDFDSGKTKPQKPKRRGKKADVVAGTNVPPPPPPPPPPSVRSSRANSKSPGLKTRKTPGRSHSGGLPTLRHAKGDTKNALERGRERAQNSKKSEEDQAGPRRRMSIGVFGGSLPSSTAQGSGEDDQKTPSKRVVKRSMSLGRGKRQTNDSEVTPVFNRQQQDGAGIASRKSKGKGLGGFLSEHTPKRRPDDSDSDSDSDGNSVGTEQSWISWVASSALKPLEKLYDDLNGVSDDKRVTKSVTIDDSDSDGDKNEFPNTEAETCSTKLSTTEKIAGLRFVASKQRRRSLYY